MPFYDYQGNILPVDVGCVSVLDYGAKGDGVTDDAGAIQDALDALMSSGGIIYFPKGTYLLKSQVFFYSHQTLWFENGSKLLQGAAINNLLMSYCASDVGLYNGTHDCVIYGGVFDGGNYTTNNTLVGVIHAKNIVFENCSFINAYGVWHNIEICGSCNIKLVNCYFEGSRKTGDAGEMIQIDTIGNTTTWPWENRGLIDSTVSKYIEICNSTFENNTVSPAIGNHSQGQTIADSYIRIHDNIFDGLTVNRGAIAFLQASKVDVYNNTFVGCERGIDGGSFIHGNRFEDVTQPVRGVAEKHNNMINGTYTA